MLYSETLGPTLARIEERINAFLVPRVSSNPDSYVEFNIEEKLQGSFEEQAAIISTSTGAPLDDGERSSRADATCLRSMVATSG